MLRRNTGVRDERIFSNSSESKKFTRKSRIRVDTLFEYDSYVNLVPLSTLKKLHNKWGDKPNNINYTFVRKWLNAQVGFKWNDVWSGICHKYKNPRVRAAFKELVYLNYRVVGNKLYYPVSIYKIDLELRDGDFYVSDGVLLKYSTSTYGKISRRVFKDPNVVISKDPLIRYIRVNGIWFKFTFERPDLERWKKIESQQLSSRLLPNQGYDLFAKTYLSAEHAKALYGDYIIATKKKQLSGDEICDLSLPNA